MAITILHHNEKYAGTHAERLAMDTSRVSTGSTYFEWDTSNLLTWSGSAWVEKNGNVQGTVQLSGSKACLSAEQKPAGQQNDTLLEYNTTTKETKVYKYISGDWREL